MEEDRTLKSIIREELGKLSKMTWGQRLEYVWEYYKPLMAAIAGILFVIYIGVTIYHNMQEISLISVYLVNSSTLTTDSEEMEESFAAYIGGLEKNQTVNIDTSTYLDSDDTSQYGIASQMKLMAVTAAGEIDLMLTDPEYFEAYAEDGYFADLRNVLTEEQQEKWSGLFVYGTDEDGNEIVTGIDLSDAPRIKALELYPGGCRCGLMVNTENTAYCGDFLEWLFLEEENAGETEAAVAEGTEAVETAAEGTETEAAETEETKAEGTEETENE